MALQVFLFVYLEGWRRGDMKRLKRGCSWLQLGREEEAGGDMRSLWGWDQAKG